MIVIPMAGKSSRFYNEGYSLPKFMLPLGESSNVFRESVKSFEKYFEKDVFLFISRTDDGSQEFVENECLELGILNYEIVSIDYDTRGQADTVVIGLEKAKLDVDNEELYIFNIDSIRLNFEKPTFQFLKGVVGYLEVFEGDGEHWSFVEAGENNLVKRTTEKIRISNLCSNGLYYFKSGEIFLDAFKKLEVVNDYNELFIAPMYNLLINVDNVKYLKIPHEKTLFCGTPKEYKDLMNQQDL